MLETISTITGVLPKPWLHVGGEKQNPDWEIVNNQSCQGVDHWLDARQLTPFADNTVGRIYASHILEHFSYRLNGEVDAALSEWWRVLVPGGELMVSVPDLEQLARMLVSEDANVNKFHVMRIVYGSQGNEYGFHKTGFNEEWLTEFLTRNKFTDIKRVHSFGLFKDCSEIELWGHRISLNMVAKKQSPAKL